MKNMDDSDTNTVCKLPDTPEQLRTKRRKNQQPEAASCERVDSEEGTNWSISHRDLQHPNKIFLRRVKGSSHHDSCNAGLSVDHGDSKLVIEPTESTEITELCKKRLFDFPTRSRDSRRKLRKVNEGITLTSKSDAVEEKTSEGNVELKSKDKGKGVYVCNLVDQSDPNITSFCGWRRTKKRRMMHKGGISPFIVEQARSTSKANADKVDVSSHEVQIISPDSDERRAVKMKGKMKVDAFEVSDDQYFKNESPLKRAGSLFGKEACSVAENGTRGILENVSTQQINQNRDAISSQLIIPLSNSQTRIKKGRRTSRSYRSRTGECSLPPADPRQVNNVVVEQDIQVIDLRCPEVARSNTSQHNGRTVDQTNASSSSTSNLQPGHALNSGPIRLVPIAEVDNQPSTEVGSTIPSQHNATDTVSVDVARQVEADEILARQLQEQLYNEVPRSGNRGREESETSISFAGVRHARVMTHPRLPSGYRNPMAIGMDRQLLEAARLALNGDSDAPRYNHIRQIRRDFNENDYEMLLALDEDNDHAGASESQINNLPVSVVQKENPEDTCSVCLEPPTVGETVRHMPCLHRFHKECIDTWLKRRTTCPICKASIT